jgi:hypothetical protein
VVPEINEGAPVPFTPVGVLFPGAGPPSPALKTYVPPDSNLRGPVFTSPPPPPPPSAPLAIPPPAPPPATIKINVSYSVGGGGILLSCLYPLKETSLSLKTPKSFPALLASDDLNGAMYQASLSPVMMKFT